MEKTNKIKGFKEYKTNTRAIADGVNLIGRHAWMLLKAFCPLMVVVSALWAWTLLCCLHDVNQFMTTDISVTGLPTSFVLPLVLFFLACVLSLAQFYSQFQGYVQNGFIPQVGMKSIWKQIFTTLKNDTLIVWLWILFVKLVYFALSIYLFMMSKYTLLLTVPFGIFFVLWNLNLLADFHVQEDALIRAIPRSFKITLSGMLSFLMVALLLLIVGMVVVLIIMVPSLVSSVIYTKASFSIAMEDGADLPNYFNGVYFIFSMIGGFIIQIISYLMLSSWTMVYGAVSHRNSMKFQSLLQKD